MEGEVQQQVNNQQGSVQRGQYNNSRGYRGGYKGQYNKNYRNNNRGANNYQKNYQKNYNNNTDVNRIDKEQIDPYTAQMLIYRAEMYILLRYPYLIDVNLKNENMVNDINENSQFFVIKSFSEEDVHKAIKYNVWTSTKSGNQTLSSAFKLTEEKGGHVYLFFSTNGSGRFVGVARMKSAVANDQFFPFWTQDNKWGGLFNIEWLFIKDVPFKQFKSIEITMKDGQLKPVSNSRDTQEIPFAEGKQMVQLLQSYVNSNTILEHFEYYDIRQENYERNNPQVKGALVN